MKQAIVLRSDLEMSSGKKITQACHASLGAFRCSHSLKRKKWIEEGARKIVLEVKNIDELMKIMEKCKSLKVPCYLVQDAGLTELKPGTITALGIGPDENKTVDKIIGSMKLLK